MCLFSARAWEKYRKVPVRKQDIIQHSVVRWVWWDIEFRSGTIWDWIIKGKSHCILILLYFFYVGKLFNEPIWDNEIWNMESVKNHQGCETIKVLFSCPSELFWISTVKAVWRRKANYRAGKNGRPWLRFSNSQEENIRRFYCSLPWCLWGLTAADRKFLLWGQPCSRAPLKNGVPSTPAHSYCSLPKFQSKEAAIQRGEAGEWGPIQKRGFIPRLEVFFRKAKPPVIRSSIRPLFTQEGQQRAWLMVWTLSLVPGLVLVCGNRLVVCLRQAKYPLWAFIPSLKMGKKCLCCRVIWRN